MRIDSYFARMNAEAARVKAARDKADIKAIARLAQAQVKAKAEAGR